MWLLSIPLLLIPLILNLFEGYGDHGESVELVSRGHFTPTGWTTFRFHTFTPTGRTTIRLPPLENSSWHWVCVLDVLDCFIGKLWVPYHPVVFLHEEGIVVSQSTVFFGEVVLFRFTYCSCRPEYWWKSFLYMSWLVRVFLSQKVFFSSRIVKTTRFLHVFVQRRWGPTCLRHLKSVSRTYLHGFFSKKVWRGSLGSWRR